MLVSRLVASARMTPCAWFDRNALALPRPPMATVCPAVDSREVVKCDFCALVQFPLDSNICRRCHASLDAVPEPMVAVTPMTTLPPPTHLSLAAVIRARRLKIGLSQRQVAGRMSTPRTYVSKLETSRASPTMYSLERLCRALEISAAELVAGCEVGQRREVNEMLRDPFLAALRQSLPALSVSQLWRVLAYARDLAEQRSRRNEALAWLSS